MYHLLYIDSGSACKQVQFSHISADGIISGSRCADGIEVERSFCYSEASVGVIRGAANQLDAAALYDLRGHL